MYFSALKTHKSPATWTTIEGEGGIHSCEVLLGMMRVKREADRTVTNYGYWEMILKEKAKVFLDFGGIIRQSVFLA